MTADPVNALVLPPRLAARPPQHADHPRLLVALGEWWHGLGGDTGARERALLVPPLFLQHFADTSTVVEDADGELVGFLIGFLSSSQPGTAYLHFVGIDPSRQRGGLGRALYDWFFATVAARGAREVRCVTSPANRASIAFHTRLGFTIEPGPREVDGIAVQPDYDGPGIDRVSFVRALSSAR